MSFKFEWVMYQELVEGLEAWDMPNEFFNGSVVITNVSKYIKKLKKRVCDSPYNKDLEKEIEFTLQAYWDHDKK